MSSTATQPNPADTLSAGFSAILNEKFDTVYSSEETVKTAESAEEEEGELNLKKYMHKQVTVNYKQFSPHISGFYYIQMVSGPWMDTMTTPDHTSIETDFQKKNDFSKFTKKSLANFTKDFGMMATDIDIPQLNVEYETVSGRNRSLNYATRTHFSGDFSINFVEQYDNLIIRYHESWFKYIDALKKGYIKNVSDAPSLTTQFINVPYFNAVWIAIFKPFTSNIIGLIKIMGVSPINLPMKQIIGDRSKSALTTINQNYKSNDMVYKFFDDDNDKASSELYKEFKKYMNDKVTNVENNANTTSY